MKEIFGYLLPVNALVLLGLILLCDNFFSHGSAYGRAMDVPAQPFSLQGANGEVVTKASFEGFYWYLFFGYTRCSSICPKALGALFQIAQENEDPQLRFLFVSIDPQQDTPDFLKLYGEPLDSRIVLATAPMGELRKMLSHYYGYVRQERAPAGMSSLDIEHSGHIYLIDPEGHIQLIYSSNQRDVSRMLLDLQLLQSKEGT